MPQSTVRILIRFLGSMNLAITLLVVIAIAAVIATVIQQNQPYPDYLLKFGPLWFELFRILDLFNVYASVWFLSILGFPCCQPAFACIAMSRVFCRHHRLSGKRASLTLTRYATAMTSTRNLGSFVLLVISAMLGFLLWHTFDRHAGSTQPLVPALNSYWMKIHVPANFVGYGTFSLAAMIGLVYARECRRRSGAVAQCHC